MLEDLAFGCICLIIVLAVAAVIVVLVLACLGVIPWVR